MKVECTFRIHRSPEYLKNHRLATGENSPEVLEIIAVWDQIPLHVRGLVMGVVAEYPSQFYGIRFDRDFRPVAFSQATCYGNEFLRIDAEPGQIRAEAIGAAIVAAFERLDQQRREHEARKAERLEREAAEKADQERIDAIVKPRVAAAEREKSRLFDRVAILSQYLEFFDDDEREAAAVRMNESRAGDALQAIKCTLSESVTCGTVLFGDED